MAPAWSLSETIAFGASREGPLPFYMIDEHGIRVFIPCALTLRHDGTPE